MSECTHDCSTCGESCSERQEPQSLLKEHHPEAHIGKVFGIVSGKGGVGKSMVTSQLAVTMRRRGHQVGILDADVTGPSIPKAFGIHGQATGSEAGLYPMVSKTGIQVMSTNLLLPNETDPVIWRGPVISGVVQQFWTDVLWNCDYLFVDMPPGTGDVSLSVFQSIPLDGIVIVASPQELVSMVVEKAVKMAEMMEVPIVGLVENMSYVTCPDCGKQIHLFGQGKTAEAAERHHLPVLAEMPIDPALAALTDAGDIESFQGSWLEAAADKLELTELPVHSEADIHAALAPIVEESLAKIRTRRKRREDFIAAHGGEKQGPWVYLIVATGNIYEDVVQATAAARQGADVIAVIRTTGQSLLDYVPYGATTEGFGGTYATQENFRLMREAMDKVGEELGRYIRVCNYCSGLCMPEIAAMGAFEGLDVMLNDALYGILFRDINMQRTLVDQSFSRAINAYAGVVINTGEDNYLTTADAVEEGHTVGNHTYSHPVSYTHLRAHET